MTAVTDPIRIRAVTIPNRLWLSPMCQYSSPTGEAAGSVTDWHLAHLGARAAGGAGLTLTEAAAITSDGRISRADLGIWSDAHVDGLTRLVRVIEAQGSVPGIQLAHAGAKASVHEPWVARGVPVPPGDGGWEPRAESPRDDREVHVLTATEIGDIVRSFQQAARRALAAGFKIVEVHGGHGYLVHSFLSPATNVRTDAYGGEEGRLRFALEVTTAVREVWPDDLPVFFRLSATDWLEDDPRDGWTVEHSIDLVTRLKTLGVDLADVSSGGILPGVKVTTLSGYQVPFAARIRRATGLATAAVGLITSASQAAAIVTDGSADAVLAGRAFLRDPAWARRVAAELGVELSWPMQYRWAISRSRSGEA